MFIINDIEYFFWQFTNEQMEGLDFLCALNVTIHKCDIQLYHLQRRTRTTYLPRNEKALFWPKMSNDAYMTVS